jgi:hypothetical protein
MNADTGGESLHDVDRRCECVYGGRTQHEELLSDTRLVEDAHEARLRDTTWTLVSYQDEVSLMRRRVEGTCTNQGTCLRARLALDCSVKLDRRGDRERIECSLCMEARLVITSGDMDAVHGDHDLLGEEVVEGFVKGLLGFCLDQGGESAFSPVGEGGENDGGHIYWGLGKMGIERTFMPLLYSCSLRAPRTR